ncbi:hypothetical protein N7468_008450 [Penicillium chermesinum]|uniref:Uncharacterized protein n=1 Tax=Penicillium chermesinum TaxID=63820 RepID=A0A9W9TIG9_9EURO|nr:uncharacterized protein N7468_008450 [Penicillium chermesinum]KAJ5223908.1 hypothetical protein N7468_008450 [Penicillium chermesinum]
MAYLAYSGQETPILVDTIDLEDLPPQSSHSDDEGKRRPQQQIHQRLGIWIAENLRIKLRHNRSISPDLVSDTLSGHESLEKTYRKIARRHNRHTARRVFMYQATHAAELMCAKQDTWSQCFERILTLEETNEADAFEICVISTDTTTLDGAFSFIDKLFMVSYERRQQAYSSLSEIAARMLQTQWALSDEVMGEVMQSLYVKPLSLAPWEPKWPSHEVDTPMDAIPSKPLKFEFRWIQAPHYANDLSVYVFRPYGNHPQIERLDFIFPSDAYEQNRRAITIVNSFDTLTRLRSGNFYARPLDHTHCPLSYTLSLFEAASSEVLAQLTASTAQAWEEINYMVYEGRLRPSGSKLQYLRHLEDCCCVMKDCCRANKHTLQRLVDQIDSIQGPRTREEASQLTHLRRVMDDIEYLHNEVESSLQRILVLRRELRESLDLLQTHRTGVLGILAALYLPLSFVTPQSIVVSSELFRDFNTADGWNDTSAAYYRKHYSSTFEGNCPGRTWWRVPFAALIIGYFIALPLLMGIGPLILPTLLVPFWMFVSLQLFTIFRSDRKNWLSITYWVVNAPLPAVFSILVPAAFADTIGLSNPARVYALPCVLCGLHGISLFVVWWWKPEFYYTWDQGRRPKPKED